MKISSKKLRNRIIALGTTAVVAAAGVFSSLYFNSADVYAKVTLRGIETIAEAHTTASTESPNPFIILEVVPSLDVTEEDGPRLGFLVGGEEPIKDSMSIKDMASKTERARWFIDSMAYDPLATTFGSGNNEIQEAIASLRDAGAFSYSAYSESGDNLTRSMDIRGTFSAAVDNDGWYDANDFSGAYKQKFYQNDASDTGVKSYYDGKNKTDAGETIYLYRRSIAFRETDDYYTGNYCFDIKKITDEATEMPLLVTFSSEDYYYNYQYFKATELTDSDQLKKGVYIYRGASSNALSYVGVVTEVNSYTDINEVIASMTAKGGATQTINIVLGDEGSISIEDSSGATLFSSNLGNSANASASPSASPSITPTASATGSASPTATASESATPTATSSDDSQGDGSSDNATATPSSTPTDGNSFGDSNGDDSESTDSSTPTSETNNNVLGAIRYNDEQDHLYIVTETNNADSNCYRINASTIENVTGGPFGMKTGYTLVSGDTYNSTNAPADKGPYYVKTADESEYIYNSDEKGAYDFIADYSKDVYETFKYSGGFTNSEWFKQYVLDRETGDECNNLYIDVISVTPDEIDDYIDKASLIYFSGGRYDDDISKDSAIKIINKVVSDNFPVMMERSTYYANLYDSTQSTDDEKKERANLTLMYLELAQSNKESVSSEKWDEIIDDFTNTDDEHNIHTDIITDDMTDDEKKLRSVNRSNLLKGLFADVKLTYETDENGDYVLDSYGNKIPKSKVDGSFVHGTVFVNDDWNDLINNQDGTYGKIVSADFNHQYTSEKLNANNAFSEIQSEYDSEKPIIETYASWSSFNSSISKATCIRYILNANNNRNAVKTSLRILDLEPLESQQYSEDELSKNIYYDGSLKSKTYSLTRDIMTKSWVKTNLEFTASDSNITITQMGTKEFIGRNDDLNSDYDLIYIGMDTALMNTTLDDDNSKKGTSTVYNDSGLNGYVYTHMGDSISANTDGSENLRLAGNDITKDKLRELTDYVKAGYAVLLSDDFFNLDDNGAVTGINTSKLDSSSNLYKFVNEVVMSKNDDGSYKYFGRNVFRKGAMENTYSGYKAARETFIRYLNVSKVSVQVIKQPVSYNATGAANGSTGTGYLSANSDGTFTLEYQIKLNSDTVVDSSGTSYDCKLYIDLDSDGKFEDSEALTGLQISDGNESDGKFHLKAGNTYTITRQVPDDYVGFLSWKLSFIQNEKTYDSTSGDSSSVKVSVTGFSAVPATGDVPTISVLQIIPNANNTLDLSNTNETMKALYAQVRDFNVQVTQITASEYVTKEDTANHANTLSYYDYLSQYDMVVIGFTDAYNLAATDAYRDGTNIKVWQASTTGSETTTSQVWLDEATVLKNAYLGIREYVMSGRSILFTHDDTSRYYRTSTGLSYYANIYLRDVMGMDRYGVLEGSNKSLTDEAGVKIKDYSSVYDTAALKGSSNDENNGIDDAAIMRDNSGVKYGLTTREITKDYSLWGSKAGDAYETVTTINEGQITQYPFLITEGVGSTFQASLTHSQYYQLNLDTDSTDSNGDDDVVVWYAISNDGTTTGYTFSSSHDYYKAVHNDVRNNYYIYSKGNVTYTGSGHSSVTSELEMKLFVNTLVAAYKSGLHSPKVLYKESPQESAATISNIYLPYDAYLTNNVTDDTGNSDGGFLDSTITINFKTINNNFRDSQQALNAKYYVKVSSSSEATLIVGSDYYKEIEPVSIYLVTNGVKTEASAHSLQNYKIYQASFNVSDLKMSGGSGVLPSDAGEFYIQIGTESLSTGYVDALQATESLPINKLNIYTTRLFELE